MPKTPAPVYQLKVTLNDTHPRIWRRIMVPGNSTLRMLHDILQIVMGWHDSHLHQFRIGGAYYGAAEHDEGGDMGLQPEQRYRLSQVAPEPLAQFQYEYDFGDGWEHTLVVEKIHPPEPGAQVPRCLDGKRACPPDDVGGVWGHQEFLKAIGNPRHAEHEAYLAWVGGEFDPDAFDVDHVNAQLRRMGRGRGAEATNAWAADELQPEGKPIDLASAWAQTLSRNDRATAESLPLRRDMLSLLAYPRDERVSGTPSTGNLSLKAVHAICARFVHPPKMEDAIGDHGYRVRSETEVWPLYFVHVLASAVGLLAGGPGRRWRLTPLGERFLAAEAPQQVWVMFATWWARVNWVIASPWSYSAGQMPAGFTGVTLKRLLALPAGRRTSFEPFADGLIADGLLVWPIQDQDSARNILHGIVERVVIVPVRDLGVLVTDYGPNRVLGPRYLELSAFRVTPFGKSLLAGIGKTTSKRGHERISVP